MTECCPDCGGGVVKGRATQKYGYLSCADCEWYERIEDGAYI